MLLTTVLTGAFSYSFWYLQEENHRTHNSAAVYTEKNIGSDQVLLY